MKIGQERTSLSERLSATAIEAEAKADALMDSMLTSFKAACEHSSSSALSTIEADMASLVLANRRAISALTTTMHADLDLIRRITRFGPWVVATSLILLIATSFALSWCWAQAMVGEAGRTALQRAGITSIQTPSGAILLLDTSRLTLATCQIQGQPVACLMPTAR